MKINVAFQFHLIEASIDKFIKIVDTLQPWKGDYFRCLDKLVKKSILFLKKTHKIQRNYPNNLPLSNRLTTNKLIKKIFCFFYQIIKNEKDFDENYIFSITVYFIYLKIAVVLLIACQWLRQQEYRFTGSFATTIKEPIFFTILI